MAFNTDNKGQTYIHEDGNPFEVESKKTVSRWKITHFVDTLIVAVAAMITKHTNGALDLRYLYKKKKVFESEGVEF